MKIGIIREGKTPPDARVPLTPEQAIQLQQTYGISVIVAPYPGRCISDEDFRKAGLEMREDLSDCDVLMGVKEVPIDQLIPDKTYFFFSHTHKEQVYNRKLLQAILKKNIRLLDYEVLTNQRGQRLIAFGRFAGMVGAHNALWTWAQRQGTFELPRMKDCYDYAAAKDVYRETTFPPVKIVLTGAGRVGMGAAEVLQDMGVWQVSPAEFLRLSDSNTPVFTQLDCEDYVKRKDGAAFSLQNFFDHPEDFRSSFAPYAAKADIMINGIFWDNRAPAFFTLEDMKGEDFNIQVIADVTCDIAPVASIPSTLFASTIADPVFGFDPQTGEQTAPYQPHVIDMMTIDNLPNEMPRDASKAFGEQFLQHIAPALLGDDAENIIDRATITERGALGEHFKYLEGFVRE